MENTAPVSTGLASPKVQLKKGKMTSWRGTTRIGGVKCCNDRLGVWCEGEKSESLSPQAAASTCNIWVELWS